MLFFSKRKKGLRLGELFFTGKTLRLDLLKTSVKLIHTGTTAFATPRSLDQLIQVFGSLVYGSKNIIAAYSHTNANIVFFHHELISYFSKIFSKEKLVRPEEKEIGFWPKNFLLLSI